MGMMDVKKWFPFVDDLDYEHCNKLFCFHHAGGSAASFRNWKTWEQNLAVFPIELPGKSTRIKEQYITDYLHVMPQIAEAINRVTNQTRIYFYGHSMGAILAFKTACLLEEKYKKKVNLLIVAGRHAPQDHFPDDYQTYMDDSELVKELIRVGGTPKELLENKEVLQHILPMVKNDYRLNESFDYRNELFHGPIVAHCGTNDPDAPASSTKNWGNVTTNSFNLKEFSGSHFFPYENKQDYYKSLEQNCIQSSSKICIK
ncbi:thioesterase domain-containing protein [Lysinibacillus sp. CNPSo 3705]|uniref:thioesterase II family protein n=1 Tax=Lysinibacillus sp. CNPSo 3705 TaxID=3028148 RepID=UPI0023634EEF|nr:thioesterase domain-containing protein [Lysinibacillus sp. CNPSo 3705]MDD1502754.1 thioesterase domain-containing protein [Lysinibacillus sp. CNPSo 3705]